VKLAPLGGFLDKAYCLGKSSLETERQAGFLDTDSPKVGKRWVCD
jgi:hypothetical protein